MLHEAVKPLKRQSRRGMSGEAIGVDHRIAIKPDAYAVPQTFATIADGIGGTLI